MSGAAMVEQSTVRRKCVATGLMGKGCPMFSVDDATQNKEVCNVGDVVQTESYSDGCAFDWNRPSTKVILVLFASAWFLAAVSDWMSRSQTAVWF
mmetsp:Transcript_40140/g.110347  ORF Transcript_40140/g.110347 Transcript_40140/m.110347 type:complete len:95 (+) Transcript_40140:78-362(+)